MGARHSGWWLLDRPVKPGDDGGEVVRVRAGAALVSRGFGKTFANGIAAVVLAAVALPMDLHAGAGTPVARQNRAQASAVCGWIGVGVSPMTADFADSLGMTTPYGAIFGRPEAGSPAASAGIEAGDVITAVNGTPLASSADFARIIAAMAPGDTVNLSTARDGQPNELALTVGAGKCPARRPGPG
jgi:serine protease Do